MLVSLLGHRARRGWIFNTTKCNDLYFSRRGCIRGDFFIIMDVPFDVLYSLVVFDVFVWFS